MSGMRPSSQASRIRRTWRNESLNEVRVARIRLAIRVAFTGFTLVLLWLFGRLLFTPLFHPKLQLAVLTASVSSEPGIAPIAFLRDDALKFLSAQGNFQSAEAAGKFFILESPEQARTALAVIASRAENASDCLVVHICAHPMMQETEPYLRCDSFNSNNPSQGLISLSEICDLLSESLAGNIVLLLDTARSTHWSDSASQDEFLTATQSLMRNRNSHTLAVITASAPGERSYVSSKRHGSLFMQAAVDGLSGLADLNADRTISLSEFYQYVSLVTSTLVSTESQDAAQQTPQLFVGGQLSRNELSRRILSSAPAQSSLVSRIASVFGSSKAAAPAADADPANSASSAAGSTAAATSGDDSSASQEDENKSALMRYWERKTEDAKEAAEDEFYDAISSLPVSVRRKIRSTVGVGALKEDQLDAASGKQTAAKKSDGNQASGTNSDPASSTDPANDPTSEAADGTGTADAASPAADQEKSSPSDDKNSATAELPYLSSLGGPDQSLLQLVQLAWQITESIESAPISQRSPIRDAPNAWADWLAYLHNVEQAARTSGFVDEKRLRIDLTAEIVAGMQLLGGQPVLAGKWMRAVSDQLPKSAFDSGLYHSIGMWEVFAASGGPSLTPELTQRIKEFDACLSSTESKEFDKWIAASGQADALNLVEFTLARNLHALGNVGWPITQQILQAQRQFERLASDPLTSNLYLNQLTQQSQRELLDAVRCAQDQIAANWPELTAIKLSTASRTLASLQSQRDTIAKSVQLKNRLILDMSSILDWRSELIERTGNGDIDAHVSQLLAYVAVLNDQLQHIDQVQTADVLPNLLATQNAWQLVEQSWTGLAESLLANKSEPQTAKAWTIDLLLGTTMVRGSLRVRLLNLKNSSDSRYVPMQLPPGSVSAATANSTLAETRQQRQQELARQWMKLHSESHNRGSSLLSNGGPSLTGESIKQSLLHSVSHRMQLLDQAFVDALPQERTQLRMSFDRLNQLAGALGIAPDSDRPLPILRNSQLSARSATTLSLIAEPTASAELRVKNSGASIENVWVVVDYDPQVIEIEGTGNLQFITQAALSGSLQNALEAAEQKLVQSLQQARDGSDATVIAATKRLEELKQSQSYPPQPLIDLMRPTTDLGSGQELVIPFQVKRRGNGSDHSKIVWKIISRQEYWRHEVAIQLPTTEKLRLLVDGPRRDWTETAEGVIVHPWPNRDTDFRLGLTCNGGKPRQLMVELLALSQRNAISLPDGFVDEPTSLEIAGRLGVTKLIANAPSVSVAPSDKPAWLTLVPLGLPALPVTAEAANVAAPGDKDKDKDNAAKPGSDIRHGMVLVLTDTATKQRMWRRVDCQVKHPRSYVLPEISYDSVAERVNIRMRPKSDFDVSNRTVAITGKVVGGVPSGTEQLLEGVINNREGIQLFCSLPATAPAEMTFAIDVDDFPRAFVFTVPCWRTQNNLPYQAANQRVGILSPIPGKSISSTSEPITAQLQVDTIPGAFASARDAIEIGWDIDQDREFRQESTLRIAADRDVDVKLDPPKGDRLTWRTKVSDVKIVMPPPPVNNGRVNLLARLNTAGQVTWSEPVEIIVDNDPPKLESVGILPASLVAQGTDVEVQVVTDDAGLSGAESVQLMRDSKLRGQWEPAGEIIACERSADGQWVGKIPTAALPPGRVNYLVRATDLVGNQSQLSKFSLEVITAEAWQARLTQMGQEVSGTVIYADAPLADAKITLVDDKGKVAYSASTNAQGMFKLAKVAVGKYKVNTVGVAKNRPRMSENQVEVTLQTAAPIRLRIQAK